MRDWPTKRTRQIGGGQETRGIKKKKRKYIQKFKNIERERDIRKKKDIRERKYLKYMNVKWMHFHITSTQWLLIIVLISGF